MIDYLRFSIKTKSIQDTHNDLYGKPEKERTIRGFYDHYVQYETGVQVRVATDDEKQGALVSIGGAALGELRRKGMRDNEFLEYVREIKHNCTRIDICYDTDNPESNPRDLEDAWDKAEQKTRVKYVKVDYEKLYGGYTFRMGADSSETWLRCYDKAKQLKLLNEVWNRVELEQQGRLADHMVDLASETEIDVIGRARIKEYCDFPTVEWFQEMMDGEVVEFESLGRKKTDFISWLDAHIAPAIIAKMPDERYYDAITEFIDKIETERVRQWQSPPPLASKGKVVTNWRKGM